ncbi:MAG: hypothetical protein LKI67_05200 [Olsenella sp.]|jgi:hypothetical protein|nr:hypothetical protein [Olsenella sp.]MCI1792453.1 hypothetical protein [Olsenella sp.]MCI1811236.1 hypothetical protein [Olsenella sp.]MCI1879847.1 hypothetical protein [Olsenella sp.]
MAKNYERAVAALVACPTAKEAAKVSGIGESTLRAYKADPEFVELYTAARHELLDAGVKTLQSKFSDAVEVICEIMHDKAASPSVRLSAASSIIQNAVRLTDQTESMERAATGRRLNRELLGGLSDIFPVGE